MSWPVYPKYKETAGSGSIPDHWQVSKLRHLLKVNPSVPESLRSDGNEMVTFLPMEAIGEDGTLDTTRERPIRELLTGYSYFANGDVIMAKVTPCFENGKAAVIETLPTTDGFGTSEVTTLRPGSGLDQRFLGYLVRSDRFRQSSIAAMTGAGGLKRVPDEHVRSFHIGHPSVAEQYGIVDFLDRETAKIDALIAKQEQLIITLREDRAATITQAVTKGLDPNVEMKDCGSGFPAIPAHWQVQPLKRLGRLITGGTPATGSEGNYASSGEGFPWFRPEDLDITGHPSAASKFISDSGLASVPRLSAPSVHVVSIGATLGKVGYVDVDSSSNQQITAVVGADCPRYTYFALVASYERIWASSMGNTLPIISAGRLGTVRLPVPPTNEQASIADYLDTRCARIDALIAKSMEMIETLREYRSALITDAVTGKIDVRGVA